MIANQPAPTTPPLSSVAIEIGVFTVHWYGLILGFAIFVALLLGIREGKKHNIPSEIFLDLVLYGVPAGIIGGRLYYVLFEWQYYAQNPADIIAVWKGGLAIHGVLIGAVITLIIYARKKKLVFWRMADIAAPSLILAQAIGRWGNFMNQEAHGGVVSRAFLEKLYIPEFIINNMYIYNPAPGEGLEAGYYYHHPTFLYESLWNLIGFAVLVNLRKLKLRVGELFFSYLIWYSFGRFFIEGLRTDSLMLTDTLRIAQVISIVLVLAAITAIIARRRLGLADQLYYQLEPQVASTTKHKKRK